MMGKASKISLAAVFAMAVLVLAGTMGVSSSDAEDIPVSEITFDKYEITIEKGKQYRISYDVLPADATNKELYWKSSDVHVVMTFDNFGLIVGQSVGTATVTATSADGQTSAQCTVTVVEPSAGVSGTTIVLTIAVAGMLILMGAFLIVGRKKGII